MTNSRNETAIEKDGDRCYSGVAIMQKVVHPHVASSPNICGGSPAISETRFPVRSVVTYVLRHGLTPEELISRFDHLTLAQVHDALAYYYDNRDEIDRDIAENSEAESRH